MKPLYVLIVVVIVAAAAFFGGMQYEKSQRQSFSMNETNVAAGRFGNRNFAGGNSQARQGNFQGNRPVSGQIVSSDGKTVTVKMADGSSKIVNLSNQTKINKASEGSTSDLKSGENVLVIGTTNSDGSVTAETISVGNGLMMRTRGGTPQGTPPQQ